MHIQFGISKRKHICQEALKAPKQLDSMTQLAQFSDFLKNSYQPRVATNEVHDVLGREHTGGSHSSHSRIQRGHRIHSY